MSRCIGCGIKIQTTDSQKPGYLPEIALIERGEDVYCKRCYDIRHHNVKYTPLNNLENYYDKIKIIKDEKALVLLIIDVLDLVGGFILNLDECIGNNQVLILVNKADVLPKTMKLHFIEEMVVNLAKKNKLDVAGVIIGSANNIDFVKKVVNKITKLKYPPKNRYNMRNADRFGNCYVIGNASVGKSTLMNQIGKLYLNHQKDIITTSSQFQTTLDFIKWPLDQKSFIIDTPGIINPKNFNAYLDNQSVNCLMVKKFIKPRTYQLNPDQTIFLGGLARIDFKGENKINASFYVSNDLYLHRTKTIQADQLKQTQYMKLLVPPFTLEEQSKLKKEKTIIFNLEKSGKLYISGIGFIQLVSQNAKIELTLPEQIEAVLIDEVSNE